MLVFTISTTFSCEEKHFHSQSLQLLEPQQCCQYIHHEQFSPMKTHKSIAQQTITYKQHCDWLLRLHIILGLLLL